MAQSCLPLGPATLRCSFCICVISYIAKKFDQLIYGLWDLAAVGILVDCLLLVLKVRRWNWSRLRIATLRDLPVVRLVVCADRHRPKESKAAKSQSINWISRLETPDRAIVQLVCLNCPACIRGKHLRVRRCHALD